MFVLSALLSLLTASTALAAPSSPALEARANTAADRTAYLNAHNNERSAHGAKALAWNNTLESAAQSWANKCVFQHSGGSLGPYGEDLAAGTGSGYDIAAAVASWTNERCL
jgi:uncharacterized protein YkwD